LRGVLSWGEELARGKRKEKPRRRGPVRDHHRLGVKKPYNYRLSGYGDDTPPEENSPPSRRGVRRIISIRQKEGPIAATLDDFGATRVCAPKRGDAERRREGGVNDALKEKSLLSFAKNGDATWGTPEHGTREQSWGKKPEEKQGEAREKGKGKNLDKISSRQR